MGLVNVDPNRAITVTAKLAGAALTTAPGRVLTAPAVNSLNTFEQPSVVKPAAFNGARIATGVLTVTLPPKSIVMLDPQ